MAIDGVGIIDSDLAHDVYNAIMVMYHNGESIDTIRNKIVEYNSNSCEMDYEIFHTAYALAMWEIGELTNDQLELINEIVSKGASIQWNDICPNAQKTRQKTLNRFLKKIELPNLKIKKRKKFKKISNTLFSKGDILAINIDNQYRCVIFDNFYQHGNDAYYSFVVTTYNDNVPPTDESILLENIPVTKKTRAGEYEVRTLSIYYKFIETHKSIFLKSGRVQIDPQAKISGFYQQVITSVDDLQNMVNEMDDILLGEKAGVYLCYVF